MFFLILTLASIVWAKTDTEIEDTIQATLELRHPNDTADWWRGLGLETPRIIISMFEKSTNIYHRTRLIQALGWFDDPAAVEFLKRQAQNTTEDMIRLHSIKSVGRSQGVKELEFLSKYLKNADPQTRLAAGEAIKRIGDPEALKVYENYLKEERTPWIVNKLRRELPRASVPLAVVASSENRLNPDFFGEWKGYWIFPKPGSSNELQSEAALLHLKSESGTELKGVLSLKYKGKTRVFNFVKASGTASKFSGKLLQASPLGHTLASREEWGFEAELVRQAGALMVQIKVPQPGAILLVRRSPNP